MATWNSAWKPLRRGSRKQSDVKEVVTNFQDYEQRVVEGLDPIAVNFSITVEDAVGVVEAIEAFLEARVTSEQSLEPFDYVDESIASSPTFHVVAESWTREPTGSTKERIVVNLRKVQPEWP